MINSNQLSTLAVMVSVFISACSSTGGSVLTAPSIVSADQSASVIGAASIGDTVSLPAGNPTGALSADVISEYFAASNRRCRQVLPRGGQTVRIACKHRDGTWRWVRALTTSEVAQPLPALVTVGAVEPVAKGANVEIPASSVSAEFSAGYDQRMSVEPGETLWKFAQRTTGSGIHWQAIAELNDIDDARTVTANRSLLVPAHLMIGQ